MKKTLIILLSIGFSSMALSQVIINADPLTAKTTPSSATSVLLEFGNDLNKGIILPYVETLPAHGTNAGKGGTLIFDASANTEYKVKVKNENNTGWTDLSGQSGYSIAVQNIVKTPQASPLADKANAKAILGVETSTSDGVLVLESANKAMILPIVTDFTEIKNPSPGMMAFLRGTTAANHRLIVFNGQKWSFWAPNN